MVDMFVDDAKFVYLYAQEQQDMESEIISGRGKMQVVVPKFNVPGYQAIYGDDPDRVTNLLLLNDDKTDFVEPDLVRKFISKYFDNEGGHHKRAFSVAKSISTSPYLAWQSVMHLQDICVTLVTTTAW